MVNRGQPNYLDKIIEKINKRLPKISVIGLGYVVFQEP